MQPIFCNDDINANDNNAYYDNSEGNYNQVDIDNDGSNINIKNNKNK